MKESRWLTHVNRINYGGPNGSSNPYKIHVENIQQQWKKTITYHPERNCTPSAKGSAKLKLWPVLVQQIARVALSNEDPTIDQNPVVQGVVLQYRGLQSGR